MASNVEKLSWFQRIALKAAGLPAIRNHGSLTASTRFLSLFGMAFNYGDWDNEAYVQRGYMGNADLYSIVNRIARTAAISPFKVYRIKQDNSKSGRIKSLHRKYLAWTGENATSESLSQAMRIKDLVYEEDMSHELNQLLDKPNQWQNGTDFTINSIGYKLITGNRFLMLSILDGGANAGKPFDIINLPPQYMQIVGDGSLYGVSGYKFMMSRAQEIPVEQIIHSKYFNPDFDTAGSQLWGLSPLKAGRKNLTRSDSVVDRSVAMFQNAGAAGLLYTKDGYDLSPEGAAQMKNKVNTEVLGTGNAGKIALANGDMGYINFGLTAQEMGSDAMEKLSMQKLCNIYSVPPGLFDPDKATYENAKEFKKELITSAVLPELSSLRDDWNTIAKLYKDNKSIYVDYDISTYPELQEDFEKLARYMSLMYWTTGNEKRLGMYMDEDSTNPLMNEYLVPNNLVPLQQLNDNLAMIEQQMNAVDQQMNNPLPDANLNGQQQNGQRVNGTVNAQN